MRNGDSADAIEQEIKNTDKASQDFASRRNGRCSCCTVKVSRSIIFNS
ncbi:hypothetical protein OK016_12730 [Vibrio chagasii]|nr:hypothetical protein [Vibrio chagasii]